MQVQEFGEKRHFKLASAILLAVVILCSTATALVKAEGGKTVKGGVKHEVMLTDPGLREIQKTAERLRRQAMYLIADVENVDSMIVSEPDVIGGVVIPAVPMPSGSVSFGDLLPPKQKDLDKQMESLNVLITALHAEIDAILLPDDLKPQLKPIWMEMKVLAHDVSLHYEKLKPLTKGPDFKNVEIGREALRMYDDMHKIEQLRAKAHKIFRESRNK